MTLNLQERRDKSDLVRYDWKIDDSDDSKELQSIHADQIHTANNPDVCTIDIGPMDIRTFVVKVS